MKALLINFLLGRGISKLQEILSKGVRHGATTGGGFLVAEGLASGDDVTTAAGAVTTLVGVGLSIARTFLSRLASK